MREVDATAACGASRKSSETIEASSDVQNLNDDIMDRSGSTVKLAVVVQIVNG